MLIRQLGQVDYLPTYDAMQAFTAERSADSTVWSWWTNPDSSSRFADMRWLHSKSSSAPRPKTNLSTKAGTANKVANPMKIYPSASTSQKSECGLWLRMRISSPAPARGC